MKRIIFFVLLATACSVAIAQEVVTLTQGKNIRTEKVAPTYRPTKPNIRLSIGVPRLATLEYIYWIKPWLMVGAGTGFGMEYFTSHVYIPAFTNSYGYSYSETNVSQRRAGYGVPWFVETEFRTPKYKWSFFCNMKIGYGFGVKTPNLDMPLGREFYTTDNNGYAVFSETSVTWHPFFMDATIGFGYKRFSMGVGVGLHGGYRSAILMYSYDIPLK